MKKKFIAVSVLICALALGSTTLTSCVDDNESASVTAIRDAKAKQLTALAGYYDAQALYQQANANYQQALADEKNQQTAQDAEQWSYELEKIKKDYEEQIASFEQQIANYKKQLAENMKDYQAQLFTNYEAAADKVNTINGEIANNLYLIAKLENGVASAKAAIAELNYTDELTIAENKAKIEAYKQMSGSSLSDLKSELAELETQLKEVNLKDSEADRKLADAEEAFKQEVTPIKGYNATGASADATLATALAIDSLRNNGYFCNKHLKTTGQNLPATYLDNVTLYAEGAEKLGTTFAAKASLTKYSLKASAVTNAANLIAAEVYEAEKALGKTDDAATGTSLYAQYNAKGEAVKTAQTTYDNALKGTDNAAIEAARKALENAKYQQQLFAESTLADGIETVNDAKELQILFTNVQKAFTGDTYKAYETAITTALAGENAKAMVAAQQEINSLAVTSAQLTASKGALEQLIGNLDGTIDDLDVDALILACEEEIANADRDIANREYDANNIINDPQNPAIGLTIDDAIAMLEADNEQLKVELVAAEARLSAAKAALDAEFGSASSEVPETPAEGEETPAE